MLENNPDYLAKKNEFSRYYEQKILPSLMPLEKKRRKYLATFLVICIFVIAWIAYSISTMQKMPANNNTDTCFGLVSCILILLLCLPMFSYFKQSKENLLPLVAGFFGNFEYVYQPPIFSNLLQKSKIVKAYGKIATDDGFNGTYTDLPITITEYNTYKYQKPTKERLQATLKKQSHGIFFSAHMLKNFTGQTLVVKDKGILNRFAHYKNLAKVGLESTEFEKKYEVYSDSQVEARYILTPVMLEYMLELKKSFSDTEYSFFDNQLFMNIQFKANYFEASNFFLPITSRKNIEKIFAELYLLFSIVDTLKLNQRRLL